MDAGASAEPFEARAYVDTGPVQERVYAQHAGIGWIGKNTCVINPELGSWMFLGEIICSLPLDVDAPALDQCGTCTLCIEACPTQAIVAPGGARFDALHLVPDHRAARRDSRRAQRRGVGIARLRLRRVPGSLSVERVRRRGLADPAWQPRAAWDRVDLLSLARGPMMSCARRCGEARCGATKVHGLRRNLAVALDNAEAADR